MRDHLGVGVAQKAEEVREDRGTTRCGVRLLAFSELGHQPGAGVGQSGRDSWEASWDEPEGRSRVGSVKKLRDEVREGAPRGPVSHRGWQRGDPGSEGQSEPVPARRPGRPRVGGGLRYWRSAEECGASSLQDWGSALQSTGSPQKDHRSAPRPQGEPWSTWLPQA